MKLIVSNENSIVSKEENNVIVEEIDKTTKLINYHSVIDNLIKTVKKSYVIGNEKEWKSVEENKNFIIHMKYENNKCLWSRAEAEIQAPKEKAAKFYFSKYKKSFKTNKIKTYLKDVSKKNEIASFFEEAKILEKISDKIFLSYEVRKKVILNLKIKFNSQKFKGIFPPADKELVLCNGETSTCNDPAIICRCSIQHKDYPNIQEKLMVIIIVIIVNKFIFIFSWKPGFF